MSHSRQFIEQLAIGDSSAAKDTLENIISNKAFEALDIYKKEMASSIFGGVNESEETNKNLTHLFSKHFGHVYDDEQSQANKVRDTVSKKYGEHVASDMMKHSNHAYDASFKRGKEASDAAKSATKIRNKHNVGHEEFNESVNYANETIDEGSAVNPYPKSNTPLDSLVFRNQYSFNKSKSGIAKETKRNRDELKQKIKDTRSAGGISGPKSKLPEEYEIDEQ